MVCVVKGQMVSVYDTLIAVTLECIALHNNAYANHSRVA